MLTKRRPDVKCVFHQEAGAMIGLVMTTGATVEDAIAMMIAVTKAPSLCGRRDLVDLIAAGV